MKKKILSIAFLLIGVILIFVGLFNSFNQEHDIDNDENGNGDVPIVQKKEELAISKFEMSATDNNELYLLVELYNPGEVNIPNDATDYLHIKFYQDNKIIYTFDYLITNLESFSKRAFETVLHLNYDKITKYEIVYKDKIVNMVEEETLE